MTAGYFIQIFLLGAYTFITLLTMPSLSRLVRNKAHSLDSVKACCSLLSASLINCFFVRYDVGISLFYSNDLARVISAGITGVAFILLLWVLFKTEKALKSGGKP